MPQPEAPSHDTIAMIGLGLMGSRMAAQLTAHGFRLQGYDPDADRMSEFVATGGIPATSPAAAVTGCRRAILSLPDSGVTRRVCLGDDGIAGSNVAPLIIYDTTTGRPDDAVAVAAALAPHGITYCDTTVSGNADIAARGDLVVMMGGPADAFADGIPMFEAIGRSHHHVGDVGAGSRMKLLVNHVLTLHRMALAEALVVAELAGLDLDATLEVLKDGLAYSRAMDAWGDRMIAGDHESPASRLRQGSKDARLIVEHGRSVGAPTDLVEVVAAALAEGEGSGLADYDNSAIVEVVRRRAGIGRVG